MFYDVVIAGAGPAGLACAKIVAESGATVLVLERKPSIGPKVCAGGITWNGLISKLQNISERSFVTQHIFSKYQQFTVTENDPIIATVNREKLGLLMLEQARSKGAEVRSNLTLREICGNEISVQDMCSRKISKISYGKLVGADGSSSMVRKYLGLPIEDFGIGINLMVKGDFPQMEWHLDSKLFGSGYAWIFPHNNVASIGAYADSKYVNAKSLRDSLFKWADKRDISLQNAKMRAERINYDFRGFAFGDIFLAGDAAGLASALTGEGIFPAIVSGEAVGRHIVDQNCDMSEMENLIRNHSKHRKVLMIARKHPLISTVLSEMLCLALRKNIIDFRTAEMAS